MTAMRIIIGGDLVPTKTNYDLFAESDVQTLIGKDLQVYLNAADYRIFNLEVPLVDEENPISKAGPNLIAPIRTIAGIKNIGTDFLTLANNHILDQGEHGLFSTLEVLNRVDIAYAGAGKTPIDAAKPHIFERNGIKVGIYCCAEHEFTIVDELSAGANPFDPLVSLDHISDLKKQVDYVIVLHHGGKEHYRYPSPNLQKLCRRIIDKGADLVICQHTHCVGCEEKWNGGTIVYGQGNFLFDNCDNEFWQTSVLVEVEIGQDFLVKYIPIEKRGNIVRWAKNRLDILEGLEQRSKDIQDDKFIQTQYKKYATSMLKGYLLHIQGKETFIFRVINKLSGGYLREHKNEYLYSKWHYNAIRNYVECEAHRELLLTGVKEKANQL